MRTKEAIEAEMDEVQKQFPALQKLTSTSQVSFFRLLKNMWILLCMLIEQRQDAVVSDINQAMTETRIGSLAWYVSQLKAFQFGDSVTVYDGSRVGYDSINAAKQIVKQATVTEQPDGRLLAKVAKLSGGNNMDPLSSDELLALKEYVRQVKYAGVPIDIISQPADEFKIVCTIKINPLVLDVYGRLLTNTASLPVLEAIIIYIRSLPFDSVLNWNALTDALQKNPGIVDFQIQQTFTRAAGTSAWVEFTRETISRAGHMRLNDAESTFIYV